MTAFDTMTARTVTSGLRFPEGPAAAGDGSLVVPEIEGGTLSRVWPDGRRELLADCGGGPNGVAFGPDGAVYVCNSGGFAFMTEDGIRFPYAGADGNVGGSLQRVDPATGAVGTVFTDSEGERLGSLNDIVFDTTGSCFVVDTTRGCLHYADPLAGTIRVATGGLAMPNGAGLSPDGTRLYVSETYSGRVLVLDVTAPGVLDGPRELFVDDTGHGWDGLAVDGAGNVCVANLKQSGITVISPDGEVLDAFVTPVPDPYVTNVCFDGGTAYVASGGRGVLYAVDWPWPSLRLNFQP
ncbi:SMP-30/gluconolactonase/LRE family protein [Trujillonella endophytica]|uniref:Gluconolactonase n=1 Tax=Trujillonella endophytica TaxID=673521 RepID=A0A1H8WR62_9ACTN|nr:SMP-30/gluconolactonase/LRE family protein [Trujillella endophytica]SEP29917.1 gluconolactonase [Trujillella endophytica]